jgi:hypothetical protein
MADKRKVPTAEKLQETDFANEKMGKNRLQANDQANVRNQRKAVPDVRQEPDKDVIESFEKLDKHKRARAELGKGNRKPDG